MRQGLTALAKKALERYRSEGLFSLLRSTPGFLAYKAAENVGEPLLRWRFDERGVHVLDREWDTLIILDCSRYDVFANVIEFEGDLSNEQSVASATGNFVRRNFEGRTVHDVVYLSANPIVGSNAHFMDIHKLVGIWAGEKRRQKRGQENPWALVDPIPVVEKAIELHEQYPRKRHVVHFLPPHTPHLVRDGESLSPDSPYRNYEAVRSGAVDAETMREVYAENLEHVIAELEPLVDRIEGKVVITGDHGELLGEGMPRWMKLAHTRWRNDWRKYDWGHYADVDVPELRDVPWLELPVESRRVTVAETPEADDFDTESIQDRLETLGYR